MRLLNHDHDGNLSLTDDLDGDAIPPYAILSHAWRDDGDEVTFDDIAHGVAKQKAAYDKLTFCASQAARDGLQHFWVDTCCIDKTNKAELTKAINSMFLWYSNAGRCYVYLSDVSSAPNSAAIGSPRSRPWESAFRASRWFERGWTLQELLAPSRVEFYSSDGTLLGDKASLEGLVCKATGIAVEALRGRPLS